MLNKQEADLISNQLGLLIESLNDFRSESAKIMGNLHPLPAHGLHYAFMELSRNITDLSLSVMKQQDKVKNHANS